MPQEVRGVVARAKGEPVSIETIVIPDPGPGEAVVKIQACGVCHTDLHYREGGINDEFPFLLGHEAAGIVEAVGPGVTEVAPGDYVILNWRAVCGECRACRRGEPWYCFATHNATQKMTLDRRHRAVARARHRRVRREDARRRRPVHEGRPGGAGDRRRAARLRRDGRHRRRDQHRQRHAWQDGRRVRLRRRRRRRHRRVQARRRVDDRRHRHRRPQARVGQGVRRHPHVQLDDHRPGRVRQVGDRRLRRRRVHRGDRQPEGVPPGVRRPRPRRHRRARRRAATRGHDRAAVHRGVRPRRRAEVELVRRLPADRGTSRC